MPDNVQQPAGLISVLLDKAAEFGDRDDAAMDLSGYSGAAVEDALLGVIMNPDEDAALIESAAESLAEIWSRAGKTDAGIVDKMPLAAQIFFTPVTDIPG